MRRTFVDYQLKGQLAYVSAGAHGIGEAIADLLTQEGAEVIVADADADVLRAESGKVAGNRCCRSCNACRRREGDGVCAEAIRPRAGHPHQQPRRRQFDAVRRSSDEIWARSFEVNLMGTVRTCRALVPKMAARSGRGREYRFGPRQAARARFHGLRHVQGRVSCTSPRRSRNSTRRRCASTPCCPVRSGRGCGRGRAASSISSSQHYGLDRDASVKKFLEDRQMPMGIGNPEDVAHAVVFLASPLARFITGAGLDIGGTIRGLV